MQSTHIPQYCMNRKIFCWLVFTDCIFVDDSKHFKWSAEFLLDQNQERMREWYNILIKWILMPMSSTVWRDLDQADGVAGGVGESFGFRAWDCKWSRQDQDAVNPAQGDQHKSVFLQMHIDLLKLLTPAAKMCLFLIWVCETADMNRKTRCFLSYS